MSSLPLADPLRMIITSRRLNFALLRPQPLHRGTLKVQRRRRVHPSLPSSPPPPSSTHPTPLPPRPLHPLHPRSPRRLSRAISTPSHPRSPLTDWSTNQCGIQAAELKL